MGNIEVIEQAYKDAKDYIVYDSFHTIMIAIVLFLVFLQLYSEWQKNIASNEHKFKLSTYWPAIRIYVLVCIFSTASGTILNLTESVCADLQKSLVDGLGGDSTQKATDSMVGIVNEVESRRWESADSISDYTNFFIDTILSTIPFAAGIFIYKHVYTFFLLGRYMWLLMLELVAPIAIVLCIHEGTRSYFYTWLKNMIICYLLIPMFLLADKFSNQATLVIMDTPEWDGASAFFGICAVVFIKIKMFGVVKTRSSQLF